jgi:membrane-bound lytic murein transglycosylase A
MPVLGCGALRVILISAALLGVAAVRCEAAALTIPASRLEPIAWPALSGWTSDDHAAAFRTFRTGCSGGRRAAKRPMDVALRRVCRAAMAMRGRITEKTARHFFERHFRPVRIARLEAADGFVTGYYEPVVEGSRRKTAAFTVPVYRRPGDLIAATRQAGLAFANSGGAWRQDGGTRVPYYDRAAIEDGALQGRGLEICWLRDPIDAFFMQIQGSARVRLRDGTMLRLNYAAHNGYPYTPVGRLLIERGEVTREDMSMQRIRAWMTAHPQDARALRRENRSFVFFRVAELAHDEQAIGAQGVPLTSGRSIAVDSRLHAYGTPFWIDAALPLTRADAGDRFRRLMIAQDTGSAIVGPARADIYFGSGGEAGDIAGRIKHTAQFVMLVPRALALTHVRQPPPFPKRRP